MGIVLIGEDGKRIGEVSMEFAEQKAKEAGKDLMMVAKNVYRIADSGRLKYEQRQKKKSHHAQRRTHKIKEIKIGPLTDKHDLEVKLKHIQTFLKKGLKTKVTMQFKARQIAFKEAGLAKMKALIMPLVEAGMADIDKEPSFEGRRLVAFLIPPKTTPK